MELHIKFGNFEQLHTDDCVDEGLTRSCSGQRGSGALDYLGEDKGFSIYKFSNSTTIEQVENEVKDIKQLYPILNIEYYFL